LPNSHLAKRGVWRSCNSTAEITRRTTFNLAANPLRGKLPVADLSPAAARVDLIEK